MRITFGAVAIIAAMLIAPASARRAAGGQSRSEAKIARGPSTDEGVESGVYGFSGALKAGGSPSGAIGECIWIYDAADRRQIAKGDCDEGNFRVALKPGRYVVHGPGGNQKIDVKPHQWVKITSLVSVPGGF